MDQIRRIPVEHLKPGMRLAEDIENDYGALLLPSGIQMNPSLIQKLRNSTVRCVAVFHPEHKQKKSLKDRYEEQVEKTKHIFTLIRECNELELDTANTIVKELQQVDSKRDLMHMLRTLQKADEYTHIHSVNVGLLALMIGRWFRLKPEKLEELVWMGFLHDIGKAMVPSNILNKPGPLTEQEFAVIQKHPKYGCELVNDKPSISKEVAQAILLHHERSDGSGYPFGLDAAKTPFFAKIIAVADTFDAMTSRRVYRPPCPPFAVFELLETTTKYDVAISNLFVQSISQYYIGEEVILSDGNKGKVMYINNSRPSRPLVKCGETIVNLTTSDLKITEVIESGVE